MNLKTERENIEKLKNLNEDLNREVQNLNRELEKRNLLINKVESDKHGISYDLKLMTSEKEKVVEQLKAEEDSNNELNKEVKNLKDSLYTVTRSLERKEDQTIEVQI